MILLILDVAPCHIKGTGSDGNGVDCGGFGFSYRGTGSELKWQEHGSHRSVEVEIQQKLYNF